jgi:hypothetical protein
MALLTALHNAMFTDKTLFISYMVVALFDLKA